MAFYFQKYNETGLLPYKSVSRSASLKGEKDLDFDYKWFSP